MQIIFHGFGKIEIDGRNYKDDVVIENGQVRKRDKTPSKAYQTQFGHTPLSVDEEIPWGKGRLVIGTGVDGLLPVMPEVATEARRRGVELVVLPTAEACVLLNQAETETPNAILHITC